MKVSTAVISILFLIAVLGSEAGVIHDTKIRELWQTDPRVESQIRHSGFHHPEDCCNSYTPRKIRCSNIKDYFPTSGGCSQPGIIIVTKRGQRTCANSLDPQIQKCLKNLKLGPSDEDRGQ